MSRRNSNWTLFPPEVRYIEPRKIFDEGLKMAVVSGTIFSITILAYAYLGKAS